MCKEVFNKICANADECLKKYKELIEEQEQREASYIRYNGGNIDAGYLLFDLVTGIVIMGFPF